MLTKEELEAINVGDVIKYDAGWIAMLCGEDPITEGVVAETRVRSGLAGNVFEDYLITEDNVEVNYSDVLEVVKHE